MRSSRRGTVETNLTRTMRLQVQSLASLSGLTIGIAVSCGVDCIHSSDLVLLWLWYRPATVVPIRPLAWEPPYAMGVALEKAKRQKKQKTKPKKPVNSGSLDLQIAAVAGNHV